MNKIDNSVEITEEHVGKYCNVSYSTYLEFYGDGHSDLLDSCGLGGFTGLEEKYGVRTLVVNTVVDYMGELTVGDKINVETKLGSLGNKSMTYDQTITRGEEVVSKARMVVVFQDIKSKKSCEIPSEVLDKLK